MRVLVSADGWGKAYRFLARRYEKKAKVGVTDKGKQYQLFETPRYIYRVYVTKMDGPVHTLGWTPDIGKVRALTVTPFSELAMDSASYTFQLVALSEIGPKRPSGKSTHASPNRT
jgi:hypothetical protein